MIVEAKTDELLPCICGFKPNHVSIGYGSKPYIVFCPTCKKQQGGPCSKHKTIGGMQNPISLWNEHIRLMTKEEVEEELRLFEIEHKANYCRRGVEGYKTYEYYWDEGKGERLYKSCR